MGRKSALTEKQWQAIEKRMLAGESARALAREFEISEAAIRKRLGARTKEVKAVANQLVAAETAFAALPISAQISARTMADRMKAMMTSMASAGESAAGVVQRAAYLANVAMQKVDDADPLSAESVKAAQGAKFLMGVANDSADIPLNLIRVAKDLILGDEGKGGAASSEGIPKKSEYVLTTDEPTPERPIL